MSREERKVQHERIVLGILLNNPSLVSRLSERNLDKSFLTHHHGVLLEAITECYTNGQTPTPTIVSERVPAGNKKKVYQYIQELMNSEDAKDVTAANLDYYIAAIKKAHELETVQSLAQETINSLRRDESLDAIKGRWLDMLLASNSSDDGVKRVQLRKGLLQYIHDLQNEALAKPEERELITPTGLYDLDMILNGGFRKGTLTYVAGRPGNGKSTLLLNMALNAALLYNVPSAIFTLEMPLEELLMVMMSMLTEKLYPNEGVESSLLERPEYLEYHHWEKMVRALKTLKDIPLYIVDCDGSSINQLSLLATEYHHMGVDSFYVDYWQLIRTPGGRIPKEEQEFAETSEGLRRLAKHLNSKFIVGAQVNRNNDHRENKLPTMRDIRNSGKAEQDAHRIITLHFPERYAPSPELCERPNELDVGIVKNRRGQTGKLTLYFNREYGLLEDLNGSPVQLVSGPEESSNVA